MTHQSNLVSGAVLALFASLLGGFACGHDQLVAVEVIDASVAEATGGGGNQGSGGANGCTNNNASCGANTDCCSNKCLAGACDCGVVGEPCASSRECCSGNCADQGTGTYTCEPVGGCSPLGEVCSDCCSGKCDVIDQTSQVRRCVSARDCLSVGEICDPAQNKCCGDFQGSGAGGGASSLGFGGGPGWGGAVSWGFGGGPYMGICALTSVRVYRCVTRKP